MRLRPPTLQDAEAVLAILVAREVRDVGRPDVTLGDLLDEWNASDLELGVASDNPRALSLYESRGMTPRFRVDTYERPVDPDVKPKVQPE